MKLFTHPLIKYFVLISLVIDDEESDDNNGNDEEVNNLYNF